VIEEHYQSRPTRRRSRSRHQSPATKA
jgi:hypothetical protein